MSEHNVWNVLDLSGFKLAASDLLQHNSKFPQVHYYGENDHPFEAETEQMGTL